MNVCERCLKARGCTLRPAFIGDRRSRRVVCIDRRGRHIDRPELVSAVECDESSRWEDYSVYGSMFDPYEDDRNEVFGEERLEFPHTRVRRWMDAAEHVYNNMLAYGRSLGAVGEPRTEFERACKVLAHLKQGNGWVHINDLGAAMDWVDRRLRAYELARFYKNRRIEALFRVNIERFLQELLLEELGVPSPQ